MARPKITAIPPRAKQVYEFICAYKQAHDGNSPTYREIADGCGFCESTSYVRWLIERLADNGLVEYHPAKKRGAARQLVVTGAIWQPPQAVFPQGGEK